MPIPLSRGPSMKLLKVEPLLQFGQSGMTRQIDLQGRDGREALGHGMKIRAGSGVLARTGMSHPVDIAASPILPLHDRLFAMTTAEPPPSNTPKLGVRRIRHLHVWEG